MVFYASTFIGSTSDDHPQEEHFSFVKLIDYPIRRLITNQVVLTPMVFLSFAQNVLGILVFISTFISSWYSLIGTNEVFSNQWWTMVSVTYVIIPLIVLVYDAIMMVAYTFNIRT